MRLVRILVYSQEKCVSWSLLIDVRFLNFSGSVLDKKLSYQMLVPGGTTVD